MSAPALAPSRTRASARPFPATAEALAGLTVVVGFIALAALTWNTWGDLAHDTGYDWVAAERLSEWSLPYEDFVYYYGPLGVSLLALAFELFGIQAGVTTAFGLLVAALAVGLVFQLARQVTSPAGAAVAALLATTAALATGNKGLVQPHTVSASVAVVAALAALVAAAAYARSDRRGCLVGAGVAAGLLALTRPEFVAAAAAALGFWLTLRVIAAPSGRRGRALADMALCLAPMTVIPVVVYGAILTQVPLGVLVGQNLVPADEIAAGAGDLLRSSAPLTAASVAELCGRLVAYAAGAGVLVAAGVVVARGGRWRTLIFAAVVVVGLALLAGLLINPEAVRSRLTWAYAWVPAGAVLGVVALAAAAFRCRRAGTPWTARDQAALLVTAFTAVLAAKTYAAFLGQPTPLRSQSAVYALPFAAVFLVWLHGELLPRLAARRFGSSETFAAVRAFGLGWIAALALAGFVLIAGDAANESVRVSGPGGAIVTMPSQGVPLQGALDAISAGTRPGEPILLAPQLTALYTLSERPNPLREISLLPGALGTEAAERAAIGRMGDVRLAITDRRPRPEYGQGAFGETFDRRLGAWLRSDFRRVATLRGAGADALTLDLWLRRATRP